MDNTECPLESAELSASAIAINDDTIIPVNLAALYLGMTPDAMSHACAFPDAPPPVDIAASVPASTPAPSSGYKLGTLRHWRKSRLSADDAMRSTGRKDLREWAAECAPFWLDVSGNIADQASNPATPGWARLFLQALANEVQAIWLVPQKALELGWQDPDLQRQFARQYIECLDRTQEEILTACSDSSGGGILKKGAATPATLRAGVADWCQAMPLIAQINESRAKELSEWTETVEPFWITGAYMIVNPAAGHTNATHDAITRLAPTEEIGLIWLTPLRALKMRWRDSDNQQAFADQLLALLANARHQALRPS